MKAWIAGLWTLVLAHGELRIVTLCVLVIVGIVGAINILVDPKGLYQVVDIGGVNSYKIFQPHYIAQYKARDVRRYRPDTLIFGPSSVTFGINPERCSNSALPNVSRIYNYGGTGDKFVSEFIPSLADLAAIGSIKRIVVEARFEHIDSVPKAGAGRGGHTLANADNLFARALRPWVPARYAGAYVEDLFSWRDLALSTETVQWNRRVDLSSARSFRRFADDGGYDQSWLKRFAAGVITQQNVVGHTNNYSNYFLVRVSNEMDIDYSFVQELAAAAKEYGFALDLFIPPEHVTELLLYKEGGIWPLFEKFKRGVLNARQDAQMKYSMDIRLFDFAQIDEVTTQSVESVDNHTLYDPRFSDPVHFRAGIGDMLMARLLKCSVPTSVPEGFGVQLHADNIEVHLANERGKLEAYRARHGDLVRTISNTIGDRRRPLPTYPR